MKLRSFIFMKGHLDTGNARPGEKFINYGVIGFFIAQTMRTEEHDAITRSAVFIAVTPAAVRVQIDDRIDPAGTIQVGPLIGEAQVRLNNLGADGLKIHAARIAFEITAQPLTAVTLDFGLGLAKDHQVIEHASLESFSDRVAPPN